MQELQLIKTEYFGQVQTDIYTDSEDMFMTANQLGECLGYSNARESINKLVSRNEYLRNIEFSSEVVLTSEAGERNTRIFTEDGIYEVTMLSRTEKAKEFRSWIRKILKSLRTGQATIIGTDNLKHLAVQAQQDRAKAMLLNAQNRALKTIMSTVVDNRGLSAVALEVFGLKAIEQVTGLDMSQHLPEVGKLYSATDIGNMFGVSSQRIGLLANANKLKTDEYGVFAMDKSRYSNKEVTSFRYNEKAIHKFKDILGVN